MVSSCSSFCWSLLFLSGVENWKSIIKNKNKNKTWEIQGLTYSTPHRSLYHTTWFILFSKIIIRIKGISLCDRHSGKTRKNLLLFSEIASCKVPFGSCTIKNPNSLSLHSEILSHRSDHQSGMLLKLLNERRKHVFSSTYKTVEKNLQRFSQN